MRPWRPTGRPSAISGRSQERASALAESLTEAGHSAYAAAFDILEVGSIRRHVDEVAEALGGMDILVNCVGAQREERAEDVGEETWDCVSDVNLKGAFLLAQAVGRIPNTRRERAANPPVLRPEPTGAARSGLYPLLQHQGRPKPDDQTTGGGMGPAQYPGQRDRPYLTRTDFVKSYLEDETFYAGLVSRIPLQRIAEPLDCAGAALFLAGAASSFITGQIIMITNGGIPATQ